MKPPLENTKQDPLSSLKEWQRLTNAETVATEADHWDELARLQMAKDNLKLQMELQNFSHIDPKRKVEIFAGEERNRDLVQEKLDDLQLQLSEGTRSMNNIQRIHRAYGHQPLQERQTRPIWHQVT